MNKTPGFFRDTVTMTGRCLLLSKRNVDTFLTSFILPVLMMVLFVYVLGGAMNVGDLSYVNYIVPGIILQCVGQCASATAISVSNDMKSGIIDRFCTMPIKKSSILSGHVVSAVLLNFFTTIIVIAVAFAVGFRPAAQVSGWIIAVLIVLMYITALSWISVYLGIMANSPQGAGAFAVFAVVLPYLSSGFVPVETMPKYLRIFAENQPMTPIIDSIRMLLLGEPLNRNTLYIAIAWCLGLAAVFYFLSTMAFYKKREN
ncbi:MAG: ABC transporter permease [Eubacteriales bacterium]|nr:ABC transporter permease [Eubacteriales bacterium]